MVSGGNWIGFRFGGVKSLLTCELLKYFDVHTLQLLQVDGKCIVRYLAVPSKQAMSEAYLTKWAG